MIFLSFLIGSNFGISPRNILFRKGRRQKFHPAQFFILLCFRDLYFSHRFASKNAI
jgi:hypothetical protein